MGKQLILKRATHRLKLGVKVIVKEYVPRHATIMYLKAYYFKLDICKKLKLSQKEVAAIAGGEVNAFSSYEHGKSKPVAAVVNLFRILNKHPELVKEIR